MTITYKEAITLEEILKREYSETPQAISGADVLQAIKEAKEEKERKDHIKQNIENAILEVLSDGEKRTTTELTHIVANKLNIPSLSTCCMAIQLHSLYDRHKLYKNDEHVTRNYCGKNVKRKVYFTKQ